MQRPVAIVTYLVLTIILPVVFRCVNRKATWYSILCAVAAELIIYWDHFCYYESRGLMIIITIIQIAVMSILTFLLNLIGKKSKSNGVFT